MLTAVRLSKSRKFSVVPCPDGVNGRANLIKSTNQTFVVVEFADEEKKLHAKRIFFFKCGIPDSVANPQKWITMIGNKDVSFGEFVTRNNVTHFIFEPELQNESDIAKVFANNASAHLDE